MIGELIAGVLIVVGVLFLGVGALGFVRLPDVFCRMHVTGVIDTLGAPLVMIGAAVLVGGQLASIKLLLATLFLAATSPLIGHLLARAALEGGHSPRLVETTPRKTRRPREAIPHDPADRTPPDRDDRR
jgi:multicomponent Na+:H+ antiporter subunit G